MAAAAPLTLRAVYILAFLIVACPRTEALRRFTPTETKLGKETHRKAASTDTTSYGQPVAEISTKTTSINHFGSVRFL